MVAVGQGGGAGGGASVVELGGLHCRSVTASAKRQVRIFSSLQKLPRDGPVPSLQ